MRLVYDRIKVICAYCSDGETYYNCARGNRVKRVKEADLIAAVTKNPDLYDVVISENGVVVQNGTPLEKLDLGGALLGEKLALRCEEALRLERRNAYHDMEYFIDRTDLPNKVGIVYGMRNTGKTIILLQLAGRPKDINVSAYITLRYNEYDINHVYSWIYNLHRVGIRYIYIDEVTWAEGFIDHSMAFADRWAGYDGIKLVLSGTDSLAFTFAENEALYHRYVNVQTTPMSYPEYHRLTKNGILGFVRSGGVFWGSENPAQSDHKDYLRTSVVENIYRTIRSTERVKTIAAEALLDLTVDELYTICYAICQSITIQGVYTQAHELWGKQFALGLQNALRACGIRISDVDRNKVIGFSREFQSDSSKYSREKVDAAIRLMRDIGFLSEVDLLTGTYPGKSSLVFTQTGVGREFVRNTLFGVCYSGVIEPDMVAQVVKSVEENADGILLESACMSGFVSRSKVCERKYGDKIDVFKFRELGGASREIDVVAVHHRASTLHLVEVKRGASVKSEFAKHLADEELILYLKKLFAADSVTRTVLYRGTDTSLTVNGVGVSFRNIENYLTELENGSIL